MKLKILFFLVMLMFGHSSFATTNDDSILFCRIETLPSDSCLYGNWSGNKESYKKILEQTSRGLLTVESITGNVSLSFSADGRSQMNYDNFEIRAKMGSYADIRYLYNGNSHIRYTTQEENTRICSEVETSNLVMKAWITMNGEEIEVPITEAPIGSKGLFNYKCSNNEFTYIYETENDRLEWIFER